MLRVKQNHHLLKRKVGISTFYSAFSGLPDRSEEAVPVVKIYFYFHVIVLLVLFCELHGFEHKR